MSYGVYGNQELYVRHLPAAWRANTGYIVGNLVNNDGGKIYICTAAGTSAASGGPTGSTNPITDNTVTWRYVSASQKWCLGKSYELPITMMIWFKATTSDGEATFSPPRYTWDVAYSTLAQFAHEYGGVNSEGQGSLIMQCTINGSNWNYYNYAVMSQDSGNFANAQNNTAINRTETELDALEDTWLCIIGVWRGSGLDCTQNAIRFSPCLDDSGESTASNGTLSFSNRIAFAGIGQNKVNAGGAGDNDGSGGRQWVKLAHWCMWNRELTANEMKALIAGGNPLSVQPNDIILYAPLIDGPNIYAGDIEDTMLWTGDSAGDMFDNDNPPVDMNTDVTPVLYSYAGDGSRAQLIASGPTTSVNLYEGWKWREIPFDVAVQPGNDYWVGVHSKGVPLKLQETEYLSADPDAVIISGIDPENGTVYETDLAHSGMLFTFEAQQSDHVAAPAPIPKKGRVRPRVFTKSASPGTDSPDMWVQMPNGINLPYNNTQVSLLCWVKWTVSPVAAPVTDWRLLAKADSTPTANHDWALRYASGGDVMTARFARSSNTADGSTLISPIWTNGWMLVGASYNAGSAQIWINGAADGTPTSLSNTTIAANQNVTCVGQAGGSASEFNTSPPAKVAHVALFNRVLPASEWMDMYRGRNPMTVPGIVNYWPMTGQQIEPDLVRGMHGRLINKSTRNFAPTDDVPNVDPFVFPGQRTYFLPVEVQPEGPPLGATEVTGGFIKSRNSAGLRGFASGRLIGSAPVTAVPLTICAWVKGNGASPRVNIDQTYVDIGEASPSTDNAFRLSYDGDGSVTGTPHTIAAQHRSLSNTDAAGTTKALPLDGAWHHGAAVIPDLSNRYAYLDGGNKGTDTLSRGAPTNITKLSIGSRQVITADPIDQSICHVAVWNVALSDAEVARLAAGESPLTVARANLKRYFPLKDDFRCVITGEVLAQEGSRPPALSHEDDPIGEGLRWQFYTFTPVVQDFSGWSLYYRSLTST